MKKLSIRCTCDKLSLKISLVWLTAANPMPAVLFSAALIAERSNLFLSTAIAVSVPPAGLFTPRNGLLPCL